MMTSIFGENFLSDLLDGFVKPLTTCEVYPEHTGSMKTDVKEYEDSFELAIELPGFKKEDVKVELKKNYLIVNATRETENDEKDDAGKYIHRERIYGTTSRRFFVGDKVKQEDIKAKFDNGILTLVVPKIKEQPEVEKDNYIFIEG